MENNKGFKKGQIYDFRNYIGGSVAGIVQVLINQPFDIIKVRLQTQSLKEYCGTIDCIQKTLKQEGLLGFYQGSLSPLIGGSFLISLQMGVYNSVKNLAQYFLNIEKLNNYQLALCAMASGGTISLFWSPIEHFRIRIQVQKGQGQYSGSLNAAYMLYKNYGIQGVYRGYTMTLLRESPGQAVYFVSYEISKNWLQKQLPTSMNNLVTVSLISGGFAGAVYWTAVYPFDTLKSLFQSDSMENPRFQNMLQALRFVKSTYGLSFLYQGYGINFIKAIIANAGTFLAYQETKSFIEQRYDSKSY